MTHELCILAGMTAQDYANKLTATATAYVEDRITYADLRRENKLVWSQIQPGSPMHEDVLELLRKVV